MTLPDLATVGLDYSVTGPVATITLDRPEALNSFTVVMAQELEQTFREVNDDDSVRAVIVTGAGRAFCAGMDLTSEGNVFGLDESKDPGLDDMDDLDDDALRSTMGERGRAHVLERWAWPIMAARLQRILHSSSD